MPEEILTKIKHNVKKESKMAFLSAIIIGFLTHMFVFTNMLPNHDGLTNIYEAQKKYYSGRFFLSEISGISSYFDLPWVNGSLSILFLALGAVILVELFKLKKGISIVLTSGLLVTFPTVSSTFSYMFTANGYMAAFTLAILSVFITRKYEYGFIPGGLILFISVGVYQINLPMVLTLILVLLIVELLHNEQSIRTLFHKALHQLLSVVIGMGLYTILFKSYQMKTDRVTNYQGLDEVGFPLGDMSSRIYEIKDILVGFFFQDIFGSTSINLFEILNICLFLLIFIGVIIFTIKNNVHKSSVHIVLVFISFSLLPFAVYSLYFTSSGVVYHMLMQMPLVFIYLIPIVLYDQLSVGQLIVRTYSWSTLIVVALIVFNFAIISNITYFNMTLRYEKTYGITNRVLDRIEQTEGYNDVTKIAMIGHIEMDSELFTEAIVNSIPTMTGANDQVFVIDSLRLSKMLDSYFGKNLKAVSNKEMKRIKENSEVRSMNAWPAKNSVIIIDDTAIVKFNE